MVLPLLEAVLRKTLHTGLSNAASVVQHLTLVVGMMGAAIAARDNRLLSLSRLGDLLSGNGRKLAAAFCGATAVAVSVLLAVAGVNFVLAERPSGAILAYGVPVWVLQASIPLGFGVMALRLAGHSATSWRGRMAVFLGAGVWILLWHWSPMTALVLLGHCEPGGCSGLRQLGRTSSGVVPASRRAGRVHPRRALFPGHQRDSADHPHVHDGRICVGGRRSSQTSGAGFPHRVRTLARRRGDHDRDRLRFLHFLYRRLGA